MHSVREIEMTLDQALVRTGPCSKFNVAQNTSYRATIQAVFLEFFLRAGIHGKICLNPRDRGPGESRESGLSERRDEPLSGGIPLRSQPILGWPRSGNAERGSASGSRIWLRAIPETYSTSVALPRSLPTLLTIGSHHIAAERDTRAEGDTEVRPFPG